MSKWIDGAFGFYKAVSGGILNLELVYWNEDSPKHYKATFETKDEELQDVVYELHFFPEGLSHSLMKRTTTNIYKELLAEGRFND